MLKETLSSMVEYAECLERLGAVISLTETDEVFYSCQAELKRFGYRGGKEGERTVSFPVIEKEKEIATVVLTYTLGKAAPSFTDEELMALARPFGYMVSALYARCAGHGYRLGAETAEQIYERSVRYINEHYAEKISISEVARQFGYSAAYFGYVFKKHKGVPANKYISEKRLERAAELLCGSSLSVSKVAELVGFDDSNYFSTLFKAKYGASPKEYRKVKRVYKE